MPPEKAPASAPAPAPPPPEPSVLDGFLTQAQFASELGVTQRTFQRWEALGQAPPHVQLGKRRYYSRESAKLWMAARESKRSRRGAR